MKKLNATTKGFITGILMILTSLGIFQAMGNFENNLQYIVYLMYIGGILWTLLDYKKRGSGPFTFKNYFSQGFKCFIVITLLMVIFTWAFMEFNPSLEDEMAKNYRAELITQANYTASEIDSMVLKAQKYFVPMLTSMAIFGYLVIGAMVTAIASLMISRQK
jgi:uncharacterized membrane protein